MLWVPEASLEGYVGYPKIKPTITGNHYYEAKLTITDGDGKNIHASMHPARKALFNIEVGVAADAGIIFFVSNPFKRDTKEQKLLATALDLMGFGAILSVVDALYMINDGNAEGLYSMLFSEAKGVIFDKVKAGSAYNELAVDLYTGMALAEKVGLDILKDQHGPIAAMEESIFKQLRNAFSWKPGQLVILRGYGDQKLYEISSGSKETEKSTFETALFGSETETGDKIQVRIRRPGNSKFKSRQQRVSTWLTKKGKPLHLKIIISAFTLFRPVCK